MKKYSFLLFCICLFYCSFAQSGNELKDKYIRELEVFAECKKTYSNIKVDFSVSFSKLAPSYFSIISPSDKRFYTVEEMVNMLEQYNQMQLSMQLRESFLLYIEELYDHYSRIESENKFFNKNNALPWKGYPLLILNDSIVDISRCVWKKTSNGYVLGNRVDSVIDITDHWNTGQTESEIFGAKNVIDKEIVFLCYNSADSSINAGMLDSLRRQNIQQKNEISSAVHGLVHSPLYKQYYAGVPVIIRAWLGDVFTAMKKMLPPDWYEEVKDMELSYSRAGYEKLWFKSDEKFVYLSPSLIRAIYIRHLASNPPINIELAKKSYWKDVEVEHNFQRKRFLANFNFLILHEFAHKKYNSLVNTKHIEEYCDCKAMEILNQHSTSAFLGVFENILVQSIKEGTENLWDVSEPNKILSRLQLLKSKAAKTTGFPCEELLKKLNEE